MADEEELNVNSASFDPLLALYSDRVMVPRPDALTLDNVAQYEALSAKYSGEEPQKMDEILKKHLKMREAQAKTSAEPQPREIKGTAAEEKKPGRSRRPLRNVLTRIAAASGPLAFLRDCMEKRIRVKVWTRNATGIRGYCLGFVIAFDKHWNLALSDVKEVWSRKAKRKRIPFGEEFEPPTAWKAMGPVVTPPKVVVLGTVKGMQTCERHVNQMLMRGEHIALISVAEASTTRPVS